MKRQHPAVSGLPRDLVDPGHRGSDRHFALPHCAGHGIVSSRGDWVLRVEQPTRRRRHGEAVAVRGHHAAYAVVELDEDAGQGGVLRVGSHPEADGAKRRGEVGPGHLPADVLGGGRGEERVHPGDLPARVGEALLEALQVTRKDPAHDLRVRELLERHRDVGQGDANPTHPGEEPGGPQLRDGIPAVARGRVDDRGHEDLLLVVVAEGADRQSARPGDLADGEVGLCHGQHSGSSTGSRVKESAVQGDAPLR